MGFLPSESAGAGAVSPLMLNAGEPVEVLEMADDPTCSKRCTLLHCFKNRGFLFHVRKLPNTWHVCSIHL